MTTTPSDENQVGPYSDTRTKLPMIEGAACAWPRSPRVAPRDAASPGLRWYMLQAQSNAERAIAEFLRRFEYEVYYPKTLLMKPVPKRELTKKQRAEGANVLKPQLIAVFPTYPFIRFDILDPRSHDLFEMVGVYGLSCTGNRPIIIDDAYVDHLRSLEADGVIPASTALHELFVVGETVRVAAGPFKGFNAVVEELPVKLQQQLDTGVLSELDESMATTIAIEIFGRATRADVPMKWLEKL
jgi:transcription antitermination factor NusG